MCVRFPPAFKLSLPPTAHAVRASTSLPSHVSSHNHLHPHPHTETMTYTLIQPTARALKVQAALDGRELHVERHELLPQDEQVLHLCVFGCELEDGGWVCVNTEVVWGGTSGIVGGGRVEKTLNAHNCGDAPPPLP